MLSRCLMPTSLEVKEMEKSHGYMNFVNADILKNRNIDYHAIFL